MSTIAFDTLKLAQRLEAAGLPSRQAQDVASALGETIGEAVVTRDYLDMKLGETQVEIELRLGDLRKELGLRLGEVQRELDLRLSALQREIDLRFANIRAEMATKADVAEAKSEVLKWMFGAVGLQTLAILGGVAALLRLIH